MSARAVSAAVNDGSTMAPDGNIFLGVLINAIGGVIAMPASGLEGGPKGSCLRPGGEQMSCGRVLMLTLAVIEWVVRELMAVICFGGVLVAFAAAGFPQGFDSLALAAVPNGFSPRSMPPPSLLASLEEAAGALLTLLVLLARLGKSASTKKTV